MQLTERRVVFVAGLHRSGTSLLHRMLGAHPSISCFRDTGVPEDEGQHLQTVYPPAMAFGGPGRFGFHSAAYMDETHPLVSRESGLRLMAEWSPHWNMEAPVLVEKSPPNLIRTRFLQALFPNASFVTLLRHPVAVACATEKWNRGAGLERLLRHWVVCHEAYDADRTHLHRVITLRYEELVGAPEETLGRVWDFLDLPPVPLGAPVRAGIDDGYFAEWERRRRRILSGWRLRRAAARLEPLVRRFGYSLCEPGALSAPGQDGGARRTNS